MTLVEKIKSLYPSVTDEDFLSNIVLRNDLDEKGDYIDSWNHPTLEQPTQEQLDGAK